VRRLLIEHNLELQQYAETLATTLELVQEAVRRRRNDDSPGDQRLISRAVTNERYVQLQNDYNDLRAGYIDLNVLYQAALDLSPPPQEQRNQRSRSI
jgi:hypothetical protein